MEGERVDGGNIDGDSQTKSKAHTGTGMLYVDDNDDYHATLS